MMRLSRTLRLREYSGEGLPQAPQHIHTYNSMYTYVQWLGSLPWSPDLTLDFPRGGRKNFLTIVLRHSHPFLDDLSQSCFLRGAEYKPN